METTQIIKNVLFLLAMNGILIFYLKGFQAQALRPIRLVVLAGYLFSLGCILSSGFVELYHLWLFGPLLAAVLVDTGLGLFIGLLAVFLSALLSQCGIDVMAYRFVLCAALAVLARYMRTKKGFLYMAVVGIAFNVIILLAVSDFSYQAAIAPASAFEIGSTLLAVGAVYLLRCKMEELVTEGDTTAVEQLAEKNAGNAADTVEVCSTSEECLSIPDKAEEEKPAAATGEQAAERILLQRLLSDSSGLLQKLRVDKPAAYLHSARVAGLSALAAERIGADVEVARTGGFYHEIGRLVSDNYIREGLRIAKAYQFPVAVADIIKQHNVRVGVPKSPEAAIVMLADSILSSLDYMGQREAKLPPERLAKGIFDARLQDGILDQCGITLQQYKILKTCFIMAAKNEVEYDNHD